jgi:DNA-binding NarL/FixJ family response regulator
MTNAPAVLPDVKASPIRVLLIDRHAVVRAGLRLVIERHDRLQVIGEAADHFEAISNGGLQPHVILLNKDLGGDANLDFLSELLNAFKEARILILTTACDSKWHYRAVRYGAMGLVHKEQPPEVLIKAIEKVYVGEVWLERSVIATVLRQIPRAREVEAPTRGSDTLHGSRSRARVRSRRPTLRWSRSRRFLAVSVRSSPSWPKG